MKPLHQFNEIDFKTDKKVVQYIEPNGHITQHESIAIVIIERGCMQTLPTDFGRTFSKNNRFRKSYVIWKLGRIAALALLASALYAYEFCKITSFVNNKDILAVACWLGYDRVRLLKTCSRRESNPRPSHILKYCL